MVNRYTVNVVIRKQAYPHIVTQEDVLEEAIKRARLLRPRMTPDMVTDLLFDETEGTYIVKVNWWPHKRGDQI